MTKSLDQVLEKVSRLPPERQDEIAAMLARLVDFDAASADRLTPAEWAEVDRRTAAPARYASDEQVEAFFRRALG